MFTVSKEKKIKMFTVSKEKKYKCQDLKQKNFWTGLWGSALKSLLRTEKNLTPFFVFPLWFDRKKIAPFFKSVARILIHKNSALKEIAIKLYDSVHGQMSNMKANLLVDLWHYHYFIQTFVFDKNII